jgi:integrase
MATIKAQDIDQFIAAGVPEGKTYAVLSVGNGLRLRLLPSGTAVWQVIHRLPGRDRRAAPVTVTIGKLSAVDLKTATSKAKKVVGKIADGVDPLAEKREEQRRERAVISKAIAEYEEWLRDRGVKKVQTAESALRRNLGHLAHRDISEIDRRDFVDAIEKLEREGKPGAAEDFRKHLRAFLNRQLSLGVLKVDPMAGYRRARDTKADKIAVEEHGRALSEPEILAVWTAADRLGTFGRLVQFGLLSGLRRGELAALKRSWLVFDVSKLTIPAEVMKAGREHVVLLTRGMATLLDRVPNRGGDLVFPSERRLGGTTMMSGWSQMVERLRRESGVDFSLHDMRKTFRSALSDLDVNDDVAEIMIAHQRRGLAAVYNKAKLWDQRRAAADKYDAWLSSIVTPADSNVIALRA